MKTLQELEQEFKAAADAEHQFDIEQAVYKEQANKLHIARYKAQNAVVQERQRILKANRKVLYPKMIIYWTNAFSVDTRQQGALAKILHNIESFGMPTHFELRG